MNKSELIGVIAKRTQNTLKRTEEAVNLIFDEIANVIEKKEKVTITGFGTFRTIERVARDGINPSTGKLIKIPERTVPVFKVGKHLRERIK